jgi:hypothetical protein
LFLFCKCYLSSARQSVENIKKVLDPIESP